MQRTPFVRAIATASAVALALSGCATPYVVTLPEPEAATATSMEKAMKYLDATRKVVRGALAGQVTDEQTASNVFIGVGALVAGLALGKVHRDAVIGAGAMAGTGYALTTNNLPRLRLQVHNDSLDALNCAERAASPLDITDTEKAALSTAVQNLTQGRLRLEAELRKARVARDSAPGADVWRKSFPEAEATVTLMLSQTSQSIAAGEAFLGTSTRAAGKLKFAVQKIGDDALAALGKRNPMAQLPSLIQGLAKDMGTFAPGANIDSLVAGALKNSAGAGVTMNSAGSKSDLEKALDELDRVARETASLQAPVNAALRGRNTTFDEDAFRDCNVTRTVSALVVSPSSLRFLAQEGGQRILEISGGIGPYFIQLDGGPVSGLTLPIGPIRGGEAEVAMKPGSAASGAKTGLRVADSSAYGKGIRIEIEVVAAQAAASAPEPAGSAPPIKVAVKPPKTNVDGALAALKKLGKFSSGGVTFERKGLPVKAGDRIEVTVICPSGGTATFKRADLAKAYLVAAGIADFPVDKVSLATDPPSCAPEPPAGPASAATAAAGASAATSQGTSGPKISADAVLTALKKVPNFASAGVSLAPKGAPVKAGDRIEASIVCPSGNTTVLKKTDIARSYLSTAGVTDFPVERMSITTEPPSCAPS